MSKTLTKITRKSENIRTCLASICFWNSACILSCLRDSSVLTSGLPIKRSQLLKINKSASKVLVNYWPELVKVALKRQCGVRVLMLVLGQVRLILAVQAKIYRRLASRPPR